MMPVIYCAARHGLSPGLGVPFQPRVLEAVAGLPLAPRPPARSLPSTGSGDSRHFCFGHLLIQSRPPFPKHRSVLGTTGRALPGE